MAYELSKMAQKTKAKNKAASAARRQIAASKPKRTKPVQKTGGGGQKLTPQQRQQAQAQRMASAKARAARPTSRLRAQMSSGQGPKLSRRAAMAGAQRRAARLQAKRRG